VALIFILREVRAPELVVRMFELPTNRLPEKFVAAAPAIALLLALGMASILKARLLCRILEAPVQGWRMPLIWAAAAAASAGYFVTWLPPSLEFVELVLGIPLILSVFGIILWRFGFTHEDRVLFRMKKGEEVEPSLPPPPGALPPGR
jgi:hypothetical protein